MDVSFGEGWVTDDERDENFLHPGLRQVQGVSSDPNPGSRLHPDACKPCRFQHTREGCRHGAACTFCHVSVHHEQRLAFRSKRSSKRPLPKDRQISRTAAKRLTTAAARPDLWSLCTASSPASIHCEDRQMLSISLKSLFLLSAKNLACVILLLVLAIVSLWLNAGARHPRLASVDLHEQRRTNIL